MADSVVSYAVQRVSDLFINEKIFLYGVSDQVEGLRSGLLRIQCFLKDADERQDEREVIKNLVEEIQKTAYDVEDVIEILMVKVASSRRRRSGGIISILLRFSCILKEVTAVHKVRSEIDTILKKITSLTRSLESHGIKAITLEEGSRSGPFETQLQLSESYSHAVEEDFVGLGGDVKELVAKLVNDDENLRVISIVGMGGMGKTTLAQKVYNHDDVRRHFDSFAWVCISQQWQTRDVLQEILTKLIPKERKPIVRMELEELFKRLYDVQIQKKCLIVLDDVWSEEACNSLGSAFSNTQTATKILITSRSRDVGFRVDPRGVHELRRLDSEESWELFRKKAYRGHDRGRDRDPRFEELGRKIVKLCGGVPLAVVLLGGILASKSTLSEWEMLIKNFNSDQSERVSEVLYLSYHGLPFKLKQCFLYLANFPNDEEINVKKLYHLWVAEGIVSTSKGRADEETMMDVAERYLSELAQRCIVQVRVKKSSMTGRFKSCWLHNLMRELCLSKAEEEKFLMVMDCRPGNVDPLKKDFSSSWKVRRLAIYSDEVGTTLPFGQEKVERVRSLLFFYGKSISRSEPTIINFKDFKLLRVLSVEGICQKVELPEAIGKLILLRYLSLRYSDFMNLPSSLGNLGLLQTLDLRVNNMRLKIPNVLWKMEQLRHLYLPVLYVDTKYDMLRLDGVSNLETLINFNSSYCDVKVLLKLTNLRKLQATLFKEQLENLVNVIIQKNLLRCVSLELSARSFSSEKELNLLNEVLSYRHLYKLYISGRIEKLPEDSHLSQSLTKLVLSGSVLEEDPMPTLEQLPRLSRLAFHSEAFVGKKMVCSATGFPQLESLVLHNLPYLELWRVDKGAFSNLVHLRIHDCYNLKMVPDGLEFIATLQELEICSMPLSFTNRLRVVDGEGEDFNKVRHVPNIRIC